MIERPPDHSQMSCFPHYHVHSCPLCHNYSYLLALLAPLPVCLLDPMLDLTLSPMLNLMLNSMLNLMLNLTSDLIRKPRTLNPTTLNHCALMSMADLVHSQSYIRMSDRLLA